MTAWIIVMSLIMGFVAIVAAMKGGNNHDSEI